MSKEIGSDSDIVAATRALVVAEASKTAAGKQQMYAETAQASAETAADGEITIVDKTKTVDGTSITIDEKESSSKINGVTELTGLLVDGVTTPGVLIMVIPEVDEDDAAVPAIPGADARVLDIGVTYDSADDSARVTLVHSYAGKKTVTAFENGDGMRTGAKAGTVDIGDVPLPLKVASGTFLRSTGTLISGSIGEDAKPATVYYYEVDDEKTHVISDGIGVDNDVKTYNYQVVNIRTGAKIPDATPYSHLHFGVWAGLEEADENGVNALADLGLGFVAGLSDMTAEMPNFGGAGYEGNWVANIEEADDDGNGDITHHSGVASMEADFGTGEVDVMLKGLASFDGTIDGNTFSGMKAATLLDSDITAEGLNGAGGLAADGKFEGNFSGAFFGPLAAEAGGVFDFASDDNEGGAFRGAFGADQKK